MLVFEVAYDVRCASQRVMLRFENLLLKRKSTRELLTF